MIAGTQLLTRFAHHIPRQNLVVYGLGGMGIAVLATAAFGNMASTAAGMFALGLCASAIFITATTLIQHETPHELLGRVMSSLISLVAGAQVISMFVAGPVAQKIGIPKTLLRKRRDAGRNRHGWLLQAAQGQECGAREDGIAGGR